MKVTVPRSQLAEALGIAAAIAPSKPPNPILANVLLTADAAKGLILRATDYDIEVVRTITEARVSRAGATLVDCKFLHQMIGRVVGETITIELDDETAALHIHAGFDMLEAFAAPAAPTDFPAMLDLGDMPTAKLQASQLARAVRCCAGSIAAVKGHYALNGMAIQPSQIDVDFVGTDGRIVSYIREVALVEMPEGGLPHNVIVPKAGLTAISRMCAALGDEDIVLGFTESRLVVRHADYLLLVTLQHGQFPNWRSGVDETYPAGDLVAKVDSAALTAALDRARLMMDKESNGVRFDLSGSELVLTSRGATRGKGRIVCPVEYSGPALAFILSPDYALTALASQETEKIELRLANDPDRAVYFTAGDLDMQFSMVCVIQM